MSEASPTVRFKHLSLIVILVTSMLIGLGVTFFLAETVIKRDQLQHAQLIARSLHEQLTLEVLSNAKQHEKTYRNLYKQLKLYLEVNDLVIYSNSGTVVWSSLQNKTVPWDIEQEIFQQALAGDIATSYGKHKSHKIEGLAGLFMRWVPKVYIPVRNSSNAVSGVAIVDRIPLFTIQSLVIGLLMLWGLLLFIGISYFFFSYRLFVHTSHDLVSCEVDLEKSRKLAELGECVSMIVHDTRNLLASIGFVFERLRSDNLSNEEKQKMIDRAKRPLSMSFEMMEDLLGFVSGKKPPLACFKHNLSELVEDSRDMLDAMLEPSGHKLLIDIPKDLIIYWDEQKLLHILVNLVRNSSESMDSHGTVTIEAIRIEGGVQVKVRDTGDGIPEELLPTLFEPFVSESDKARPGLGLAIIRDLVERHGGNISARNHPDGGAEFDLSFPDCPDYVDKSTDQTA